MKGVKGTLLLLEFINRKKTKQRVEKRIRRRKKMYQ